MLIAGVLCLGAAVVSAAFGLRALRRPGAVDPARSVVRMMAPAQLAAAVMLTAAAVVALGGPPHGGLAVLIICVAGALGTCAAGSWQSARYAVRRRAVPPAAGCSGDCACSRSGLNSC